MKKYLAWGGALIAATTAMASLIAPLPAQVSFCSLCGARQETKGFIFRPTGHALYHRDRVAATDFSALFEAKELVTPHMHAWQQPALTSDPLNEFGPSVVESLDFLNTPRVLAFTRNVTEFADPISVARWHELALQPHYARLLDGTLRFLHVPEEGFPDRTSFLTWWGRNSFAVYNRLRELTEPD